MSNDHDLTEDEVADLKEAFAMFDINGDGRSSFRCSYPSVMLQYGIPGVTVPVKKTQMTNAVIS